MLGAQVNNPQRKFKHPHITCTIFETPHCCKGVLCLKWGFLDPLNQDEGFARITAVIRGVFKVSSKFLHHKWGFWQKEDDFFESAPLERGFWRNQNTARHFFGLNGNCHSGLRRLSDPASAASPGCFSTLSLDRVCCGHAEMTFSN